MTSETAATMRDRIRGVIAAHGHLPVDVATLADDADLFQAGMTSHASVNLMLGLEAEFDIEFPDAMLKRSVFQSVSAIADRPRRAGRRRGMSVAVDRDQAFLATIRRIADEVAAPNADDVDRNARFPQRDDRRPEGRASAVGVHPRGVRRRRRSPSRPSPRPASSWVAGAGRAPWSSRCTTSRWRPSCGTSTARRRSRPTCATSSREQRLVASVTSEIGTGGDMGRSIAAVTPDVEGRATFEKQAPTVSYGGLRGRPPDDPPPSAGRRARRPGPRPDPARRVHPRADRDVGSDGDARHVLARLRRARRHSRSRTSCPRRSRRSARSRWCRSRTSSGRTSGWGSPRTRSIAPARSSAPARGSRPDVIPPTAARLSQLMSELSLLRAEVSTGTARLDRRQRRRGPRAA